MAKRNNFMNKDNAEKYEKGITKTKIAVFFDWVWRLFIINTFTILTSLGVITIFPSLVACFRTLKECYEDDEQHIVKRYFANFVYCFQDTVGVGCFFLVIFAALIYSFFYYTSIIDGLIETGSSETYITIFWGLFFFSLIAFFILFLIFMQLPMVVTYIRFRFFNKIKFAIYMAFKHFGGTLEEFLVVFMWSLLCFVIWVYVPIVFAFIVTIPMFLVYRISRKYYWGIENQFEYEYEEDEFDLQNKVQVRETYEDKSDRLEQEKKLEEMNNDISKEEKK